MRRYFNPRPPWGGRQGCFCVARREASISIHALRGEGDARPSVVNLPIFLFQSTPSVGRATRHTFLIRLCFRISIHALRGEGDTERVCLCPTGVYFNPRPPWGGRRRRRQTVRALSRFQSTPSVGRATQKLISRVIYVLISIHALRGEGDFRPPRSCRRTMSYFNPRPPWGGRLADIVPYANNTKFQSTPSVGRATACLASLAYNPDISIHALRGEGDVVQNSALTAKDIISIHALRGEGDDKIGMTNDVIAISIHALRGEGDKKSMPSV